MNKTGLFKLDYVDPDYIRHPLRMLTDDTDIDLWYSHDVLHVSTKQAGIDKAVEAFRELLQNAVIVD